MPPALGGNFCRSLRRFCRGAIALRRPIAAVADRCNVRRTEWQHAWTISGKIVTFQIRRITFGVALASLLAAAGASAQTALAGWQAKATQQSWIATSPAQNNGDRVRLVFYPVAKASGEIDAWFDAEIVQRTKGKGILFFQDPTIHRNLGLLPSPLLRRVAALSRIGQARSIVVANFGYETNEGRQFAQIIMPAWPGKPSEAYLSAVNQVMAAWKDGVVYRAGSSAQAQPAAPTAKN